MKKILYILFFCLFSLLWGCEVNSPSIDDSKTPIDPPPVNTLHMNNTWKINETGENKANMYKTNDSTLHNYYHPMAD